MSTTAISRRRFLQTATLLAAGGISPARAASVPRPNLLVLVADDLRHDTLGYAGDTNARTPHLDALAARGVRFRENFVTTSICATSRASILTGQYALKHGVWTFSKSLDAEQLAYSYPGRLKHAGYYTGFVGKYGVGTRGHSGISDVFDVFRGWFGQGRYWQGAVGKGEHLTDHLAAQSRGFLERAPAHRPFCLSVSFKAPHVQDDAEETEPFQPHPRHLAVHATTVFPRPVTATAGHFERLPAFLRDSEARRRWQTRFGTEERRQESLRRYYALVTGVDAALGEILATLDATGRGEDTVVVFTSDNGFFLGEHGLAGKWYGFDESIRTPLLIAPAAASASADVHLPTLNIDLAPTLIDLAGLPIPERMQGRSLRPLLTGERPAPSWRRDWLYEHRLVLPKKLGLDTGLRDISKSEGIRSERYKYLVHYDEPEPNVLLFDLQADPHEEWNLASTADPKLLATLEDRLVELRAQAASD